MRIVVIALAAAVIGAIVGILGYVWVVGGDGAASEPISAPTLDVNAVPTLNPTEGVAAVTQVAELSAQVASLQATNEALVTAQAEMPTEEIQPTAVPTEEAAVMTEEAAAEADSDTAGRQLYRIDPANSTVTFMLQEDLRGVRTDVIGTTTEVAGDVILDFDSPVASQIGTIRINARTLATDNEFRNRALRAEILRSSQDEYEFVEFTPTAIEGLPDQITVGETYDFNIIGDLTILGQTKEVTFSTQASLSDTQITGTATTNVIYGDWGISIPNVPQVANVTEDVTLTLDFVALQVEE
ncbi:MAG: YceI family protein [Anaerolineae bacterium]|nr:YceI family protein [Anaerolineae bacterium]